MKKQLLLASFAFALASTSSVLAAKKNSNASPYPYGNPVITHMYTADAAPKVMPDGRVWMVTSIDHEEGGGYSTMHAIHAFSTADMKTWIDHGEILGINDFDVPKGEDWAIWAPDIIYRNGTYYLYFPMRNLLKDGSTDRYVAVAESDRMDKRFQITNPRMKGVERAGLDPSVFIDDDGVAYLYWNQALMGVLNNDMREIDGKMFKINYGSNNFMEAAWMHKRQGIYYYNYHTKYDGKIDIDNPDDPNRPKSELHYSMGSSPRGPLEHKGVINYELGVGVQNGPKMPDHHFVPWRMTQSNHGAVVEFHGQEYFFYHTSALSSWRQDAFNAPGTWTQRSVCVDYLNYNDDGTAIPVKQTVEGVNPVTINQPFEIALGEENKTYTQSVAFKNMDLGSGYYYLDVQLKKGCSNGRIEVRLGSPNGPLIGTILAEEQNLKINGGISDTFLREANGKHDVHLVVKPENGKINFTNPRIFAGSPKNL